MDFKYPYTDFHELNLDWFLAEFKKLTAEWLQVQHDWEDEQQAFQDLHDYVENYFANLDLYQEVHDILWSPEMQGNIQIILSNLTTNMLPGVVADQITAVVASQLSTVVALQLPAVVEAKLPAALPAAVAGEASAWLADHVDPATGYVIDDTLTIALAAADAKATGDRLTPLERDMFDLIGVTEYTGEVSTQFTMTTIADIAVKADHKYSVKYYLDSAVAYTVYCYLNIGGTQVYSGQITAGNTELTATYNSTAANSGQIKFQTGGNGLTTLHAEFKDLDATIPDILQVTETDVPALETYAEEIDARQKQNSDRVDDLAGYVAVYESDFDIGSILITNSGWTYDDANNKTIRTRKNVTLSLKAGDIIKLSDYTDAKFYVGWRLPDNTYGLAGWNTSDYTCQYDGEYVLIISNITQVTQTDVNTLLSLLSIIRTSEFESELEPIITDNPLIKCINHRGYAALAPENTLPAYKLSKTHGFKYVECDVAFTSDDVPVLMHDDTVDRTTDGSGYIWDLTYAQVEALDAGSWFSPEYAGTKVPSLDAFMKLCKQLGLSPYLELKATNPITATQLDTVADIVKKYAMQKATTFICINIQPLADMITRLPECRFGIVSNSSSVAYNVDYVKANPGKNLFIDTNDINSTVLQDCIDNDVEVEWWLGQDNYMNWDLIPEYVSGMTSNVRLLSSFWYHKILG